MNWLRDYLQPSYRLTEYVRTKGRTYTYTLAVTDTEALFQTDRSPLPWEGGPVLDGIVLGMANETPYVVFLELKSVTSKNAQSERAQIEKANRQILSGIFHFLPSCRCHNLPVSSCPEHHGEMHHQRWGQDVGPHLAQKYQGHQVRGTILLFRVNLQRTVSPPTHTESGQGGKLGGQDLCPRKVIPKFKIIYRSIPPHGTTTIPFAQLV